MYFRLCRFLTEGNMIDKDSVASFFDEYAPTWDEHLITDDRIINIILDNCRVSEGKRILDVACGTGVMVPYYLERHAAYVAGADISRKMIEIAQSKFHNDNVRFFRMDAENELPEGLFDVINIYNAFPHFDDARKLIMNLSSALDKGGVLSVAHGMSREKLTRHHSGSAAKVSNLLPEAEELAKLFAEYLEVSVTIDNDEMYQVCGIKR